MKLRSLTLIMIISVCFGSALTFGINPEYQKHIDRKNVDPVENATQEKLYSVSGRFDGKNRDTITAFPLEESGEQFDDDMIYSQWILVSKNGTVPSRQVETYWPELIYEGDLDGNGCDEFGVLLKGFYGTTAGYNVFTCHNGKLADFLYIDYLRWDDSDTLDTLATPADKNGRVRLIYNIPGPEGDEHIDKTVSIKKFLHHK